MVGRANTWRIAVAVIAVGLASPAFARSDAPPRIAPDATASPLSVVPDLGVIRYRDPARRREIWLGVDVGGVALPPRLTGLGRRVWSVSTTPAWAIALAPRVAIGGRHGATWYDAENIRLRVHTNLAELSGRPIERPRLRDRVALGVEVHDVAKSTVDGVDYVLGGVRDVVLHAGYGMTHRATTWLELGWRAQLRHAWLLRATQRHVRASVRAAFHPRPHHRVALEAVGYYVNRDRHQPGAALPTDSVHGQLALEYAWMAPAGVGFVLGGRATTSLGSGEAPIFEIRQESARQAWAEGYVGLRAAWH